jgi:hypothetical protein
MVMSGQVSAAVERILKSPLGQEIEREAAAELQATRRGLAAELRALDAARERSAPQLTAGVDKAVAAYRAVEVKLKAAGDVLATAQRAMRSASWDYDRRRAAFERELRMSAPAELFAFLAELDDMAADARNGGRSEVVKGWLTRSTYTNRESIVAHLAAIREARPAVEALMLEALEPAELAARIAAIRRAIPPIEGPRAPGRDGDA